MSIKNKLVLLFVLLLSLLVAVQTWLFYQYTDEVAEKIGETAFAVSKDTASVFVFNQDSFHQKKVYTYKKDGQIHTETLIGPSTTDIKLRLTDDSEDDAIQIIGNKAQFQIPIPRMPLESSLSALKNKMLWITLALFGAIILIATYITYNLTRPLTELSKTAKKISLGELGAQVELNDSKIDKELSQTLSQFNRMSDALVDLSQQKAQQQELEHFRELSDISRGLAHNLRNPLNTLLLSIEQLAAQNEVPQANAQNTQLKALARKQVQRIDEWIKNFMLLMEQGLQPQQSQLNHIIHSAINHCEKAQNVDLFELELGQDYALYCIETELSMIIQIVLQNAVEANIKKLPIKIITSENGEYLIIQIIDQGKGIEPQILKELFTPYVTDKTYGTGMGLYIAQRIVKHRYNGTITLESTPALGTKVSIKINKKRHSHEAI